MATFDYKVYLTDESAVVTEVRRFSIDKNHAKNLVHFCEKLESTFPHLQGKTFTVYWKDSDGDSITISSSEELEIALNEMSKGEIYKFFVTQHSESKKEEQTSSNGQGVYHHNVICDGCEGDLQGFRYKCIECEDYDLCAQCEALGLHPEHSMIRISQPVQWSPHYSKRLRYNLRKILKKSDSHFNKEDGCPMRGKRHHGRLVSPTNIPFWINVFASCINDWANVAGEYPIKVSTQKKETQPSDADKPSDKPSDHASKQQENMETFATALKLTKDDIKHILDSFGIDVDIEIVSDANENNSQDKTSHEAEPPQTSSEKASNSEKFPGEGKKLIDDKKDDKTSTSDATPTTNQDTSTKAEVAEEWAIVDRNEVPAISHSSSASSSLNEGAAKQVTASAPPESGSPKNEVHPEQPDKETKDKVHHPNPKVQRAVETMLAMGFTNRSGLLSHLLEVEDGDIGKVLDVLFAFGKTARP